MPNPGFQRSQVLTVLAVAGTEQRHPGSLGCNLALQIVGTNETQKIAQ